MPQRMAKTEKRCQPFYELRSRTGMPSDVAGRSCRVLTSASESQPVQSVSVLRSESCLLAVPLRGEPPAFSPAA